ncbi:hypothetical protein ES705_33641 [subsurface metagenome]
MNHEVDCIYINVCDPKIGICNHPKRRSKIFKRKQKCVLTITRMAECGYQVKRGKGS